MLKVNLIKRSKSKSKIVQMNERMEEKREKETFQQNVKEMAKKK